MKFINMLEKKFGKYAIKNLMLYIIVCNIIGMFATLVKPELVNYLTFNPIAFMRGEVWRLVTVFFMPTFSIGLLMAFVLYFYYFLGSAVENIIGSFKFNLFYFSSYLLLILVSLLTGLPVQSLSSMNLSLFLIFAILVPNQTVLLFFVLPIKVKVLAWIYIGFQIYEFVRIMTNKTLALIPTLQYGAAMMILVPLISAGVFWLLFRNGNGRTSYKNQQQRRFEKEFKAQMENRRGHNQEPMHRCTVCGRTENDDETLEFRFCSKCDGNYEYCSDHLFNHEHK